MELQEILEAVGYTGEADKLTREAFVGHLNAQFVNRQKAFEDPEVKKQAFGRVYGEIAGTLAKLTGKSKSELQEMGNDKAFELLQETWAAKDAEIQSIKEKSKEGQAKQVTELTAQVEDLQKSLQQMDQARQTALEAASKANDELKTGIRDYKVGMVKKDLLSKLPWAESANEYLRRGVLAEFDENYRIELGDDDTPVIKTAKGELIPDPKKAGAFLGAESVLTGLAEKAGALKNNNGGGAGSGGGGGHQEPKKVQPAGGDDWVSQRIARSQEASKVRVVN